MLGFGAKKVTIGHAALTIAKEGGIETITVRDPKSGTDEKFIYIELPGTEVSPNLDKIRGFLSARGKSGEQDIPVISEVKGRPVIIDRHDTPGSAMDAFNAVMLEPDQTLQRALEVYHVRVAARNKTADIGETNPPSEAAKRIINGDDDPSISQRAL